MELCSYVANFFVVVTYKLFSERLDWFVKLFLMFTNGCMVVYRSFMLSVTTERPAKFCKLVKGCVCTYNSPHNTQCYWEWLLLSISLPGEVYAIGGYNGVKTVDVVEKYNPEEEGWKEVAPLVFGRSVPGIAVAHLWPVKSTMKSFWEPESQLWLSLATFLFLLLQLVTRHPSQQI